MAIHLNIGNLTLKYFKNTLVFSRCLKKMRSLIGAPNNPIMTDFLKDHLNYLISKKCCVLIEGIPTDFTKGEIETIVNNVGLETVDIYIPFNLKTQQQLPKAYIFLFNSYGPWTLMTKTKNRIYKMSLCKDLDLFKYI